MAGFKLGRLTEDMKRELSILIRELKDPRIDPMLSVVKVQLANDLSHCKVYVSTIQGMEQTKNSVKGLVSASGYLKRQISQRLHLRKIPGIDLYCRRFHCLRQPYYSNDGRIGAERRGKP